MKRYDCTNGGAQFCSGCYQMTEDGDGLYVRHTDAAASIAALESELARVREDAERLRGLIDHPEIDAFLRGVHIEAVHQVDRWGTAHDRAKRPADWFWLVGYLAGKALHSAVSGSASKALHHCISTAAALYNWHSAINGTDVSMCPGRSDLAEMVESEFPNETVESARTPAADTPGLAIIIR